MTLKPLHDRVVVRRIEADATSRGGIIIPDNAAEKPNQGEVIAVGPGATLENGDLRPPVVAIGDRVLFGKYSPTELTLEGEEVLILRESDLLAILETTATMEKAA